LVDVETSPAVIQTDGVDNFDFEKYEFFILKSDIVEDDIAFLLNNYNFRSKSGKGNEWLVHVNKLLLNFVHYLADSTVGEERKWTNSSLC